MLDKFLKEVIVNIAGKQAEPIVSLLNTKKYVNEFLISKKLDITINQTRNILYKISDYGLLSSIRKKDKKKGWYTYFWRIEVLKSLEFLREMFLRDINQLKSQINSRETKEFYVCEKCNIEFNQENALIYNFTCNECGGIFSLKDNTKFIAELKKNLNKLERELKVVDEEIQKEKEKSEKQRMKEREKEISEKKKVKSLKKTDKEIQQIKKKSIKSVASIVKKKSFSKDKRESMKASKKSSSKKTKKK